MQHSDVLDDVPDLKKAVEEVCRTASSDARRKQIRAHARELVRALKHPAHPLTVAAVVADVFNRDSLQAYERLALDGELRERGPVRPTSDATARVRSAVMVLLQRELGLEVVHLRSPKEPPPITPVDIGRREGLRESLEAVVDFIGRETGWSVENGLLSRTCRRWVRILAQVSVVLDTGARVGELCALRLDDLSPALDEVRIVRRPQSGKPRNPDVAEVYRLRRPTRVALERWFLVRRLLSAGDTDGGHWLWVSTVGGRAAQLQPIGVSRSYVQTVTSINSQLSQFEGWEPLPVRMEQLRRGVSETVRVVVPRAPDDDSAALLMGRIETVGRQLAALPGTESLTTGGIAQSEEARRLLRAAWRIGIEHREQLAVLGHCGLAAPDFPRVGWNPQLLRALS